MKYGIGIDIGSTCAKTIVMGEDGSILRRSLQPTGWSSVDTAEEIRDTLAAEGYPLEESRCVATGYGRVVVPYAKKAVTEIERANQGRGGG